MSSINHRSRELISVLFTWLIFLNPFSLFAQEMPAAEKFGGTVHIGMKGDFDSFNELNSADSDALQVISNMLFMPLTRLDETLNIVPYLAKSWQFSNSDSVLTYTLRDDIYWTDGVQTTAEDVYFTWKIATDPGIAYPAASRFDLTRQVEVLNQFQVRFRFHKPYPDALLDTQMPILPRHVLENIPAEEMVHARFNRAPVSNGPFILKSWKAKQSLVFEANETFGPGRPLLDRVVFSIIPDETVLYSNLIANKIDLLPALTPASFSALEKEQGFVRTRYGGRNFTFAGWNLKNPLLSRPLRQALSHGIDKQEIIGTLLNGYAEPAKGPLLPFAWAYDPAITDIAYSPRESTRLLLDEGWKDLDGDGILEKDGKPLLLKLITNVGSQMRKDVAVMVQAQLAKIGVGLQIDFLEWNSFIDAVFVNRTFDGVIMGWDADFSVNPVALWHSAEIEEGYNFISYQNSRVDSLLTLARRTTDRQQAMPMWAEFQQIVLDDCPYTFLFVQDNLLAHSKRIHDVNPDVRGFLASISQWRIPLEERRFTTNAGE